MKYIYSFWSKKFIEKISASTAEDAAKLIAKERALMSKSLSCLFDCVGHDAQVDLVSDDYGARLFSMMPFSNIRNDLERINIFSSELWAVGKIYSLSLYNEPVCHIDYDFIIKDGAYFINIFNDQKWDVLVQSKEVEPAFSLNYKNCINVFLSILKDEMFKNINELYYFESYNYAYNCGILGFRNISAKNEFVKKTMQLFEYFNIRENDNYIKNYDDISHLAIPKNKKTFEKSLVNLLKYYNLSDFYSFRHENLGTITINCIIEQFFLTVWSNYKNLYVKEVCPIEKWNKINGNNKKMNNFNNENCFYVHYVANQKNNFVH